MMFKKICALCITLVILLSLGTVMASAALPEDVQFWPGEYGVSEEDFSAFGDIEIQWDSEASSKLNLTDGKMDDWNGYDMVALDAANMVSWVGDPSTAPNDWAIKTYFVADSEWLYIGFFVFDQNFAYGENPETYDGDVFQVCIDFGGLLGDTLKNNPDSLVTYKNFFYSFSGIQDGAPLQIMRQESDNDKLLSEADGDGVKGAARKTVEGWSAEFALSWQQLYDDYVWKAWIDDPTIYVGGADNLPLKIGCCLYYLDRDETAGDIKWAAGTTNGITNDAGEPLEKMSEIWKIYDAFDAENAEWVSYYSEKKPKIKCSDERFVAGAYQYENKLLGIVASFSVDYEGEFQIECEFKNIKNARTGEILSDNGKATVRLKGISHLIVEAWD